jgi:hypothetical protein
VSAKAARPVEFDLRRGRVQLRGAEGRLLLPVDAVELLCQAAAAESQRAFGQSVGSSLGLSIASRAAGDDAATGGHEALRRASTSEGIELLGTELALLGLGSLSLERWGRAVVLVLDHCPLRGCDAALEELLSSALEAATGSEVVVVRLESSATGDRRRFAVCGEAGAAKLRDWLGQGVSWGDAIVRLHASGPDGEATPAGPRGGQ